MWCYWRDSSYFRRDHAHVYLPHGPDDSPCGTRWHASPPWFGCLEEDRAVARRGFRTPEAAMAFADRTWPEGSEPGATWWKCAKSPDAGQTTTLVRLPRDLNARR